MTTRRTLPLRRWLVLLLAVAFIVPVVITAGVAFHTIGRTDNHVRADVTDRLFARDATWSDPTWQSETVSAFAEQELDIVLSIDGQAVFRSVPDPLVDPNGASRPRTVERLTDPADPARVAEIYSPNGIDIVPWQRWQNERAGNRPPWQIPLVGIGSLLLTLLGIGWFLGRTVVSPLDATATAAARIAEGDLAISLPTSRVREVATVNTAVTGMSAALRTSLRQQTDLEQERRFFIAAIAHDLRTPLFALRGSLEGIVQGVANTPEKTARYLAVALDKAAALDHLINDLFAYTRLEYLDQSPTREPVDIADLLNHLVGALQPQAANKPLTLTLSTAASPTRPIVSADPHLLTRAIGNILDNALRFTPPGGAVTVTVTPQTGQISIAIADTGPGIPAHDLPNLFAPLFRGESSRNRSTGGAGLGLAVARRIILAHSGTISAANLPSGGAQFVATLPSHGTPGSAS